MTSTKPPVQLTLLTDETEIPEPSRSLGRRRALLVKGLKLTETRDWDALTIEDIAAAHGFPVESFLTQFRDKQAYLDALAHNVASQMRKQIDAYTSETFVADLNAHDTLESFVDEAIRTYTQLRGVIRASVLSHQHSHADGAVDRAQKDPFLAVRAYSRELFIKRLAPLLPMPIEQSRKRLSFSHQMMNSTLFNCILSDPGPIGLKDDEFRQQLVDALSAYLELR